MAIGFKSQCVPTYRVLTEDQIKEIHLATLEVLEKVGVRILDEEGIQLLKEAGCQVKNENVLQIPRGLVEESIHSAPSSIQIYNRKGNEVMQLGGDHVYFGLGTDLIYTYDLKTGSLRRSCLQDVVNAAKTGDCLEEIDFIASFALAQDVPTNLMYIECFKALLENSIKPIFFTAAGAEDLSVILQMAEVVAGDEARLREKPFLIHYSEPTSPLSHSKSAIRKLFLCADKGIPINYTPALLAGATGPVTLAGAITVANAEALSGVVLHQRRAKGAPIISGFVATTMDMLTSTAVYGGPEFRLTHSACTDLYHYYGLPVWGTAGASDAHCFDQQAAMEATFSILMGTLEGANLIHDVGYLGQGLIGSPATIVMGSEIISYVKRIRRGFDISQEQIAMEVIQKVGPGGNFLTTESTRRLHRQEHWRPKYMNRDNPDMWKEKGSKTYGERVTQKALEILETHRPEPLPDSVRQKLEELIKKAEKSLMGIKFVV
ncbi:MAG: trimethylamine methyltransferase family protein [Syntrophaceae bacterium]|nr:trimethylamine methyltransferase family protein [Syntrophaceae bacterium]